MLYADEELILELNSDPDLKKRFLENPAAMLKERGLEIPPEVTLRVMEDTPDVRHIVIPYIAPGASTTLEEIEQRASKIIL
ncbi:MAG: nitrile hydratase subunit alpha [Coprothermobacterota bacterium]|jgi:hypothetical protein|nr:nitrile hydratase subunit alpha [Coprothermobacterota bacterium]